MRDFLEEAEKHRDDGFGRAQAADKRPMPIKFYGSVGIVEADGGFAVGLDGKPVRTPTLKLVSVPSRGLAEAMAAEWAAQDKVIDFKVMPLTRLVNAGVEAGDEQAPALRDEVAKYASSDLLLYRADHPRELAEDQEARWDPVLIALARHFGIKFQPTVGIMHQVQPPATLTKLRESLEPEGTMALTALNSITSLTGSGLLTIALRGGLAEPEAVWTAAHVDEDHNIRLWGRDEEAEARRVYRRREYDAALTLLRELT